MRVPEPLTTAFGQDFEALISRFAKEQELLPNEEELNSKRFLARSVVPHVRKLSSLFNRTTEEIGAEAGLDPYWKSGSNPANLRLAYFLYFMPCNLFRVSAIWAELGRLGFRWSAGKKFKGIDIGAGPATAACGIAAGERYASTGIPLQGDWALIEQDKAMLRLGESWAKEYFPFVRPEMDWGIRPFHRKTSFDAELLPKAAPKFNLWVMSYFLNESEDDASKVASRLIEAWERHLEDEGIIILVEPALRAQSRRILELRKALLAERERGRADWLQILLPCLGHQACGALAVPDDWCHEEVGWWRPPYFRVIDAMASLDRKTLPFSYLVIAKSKRAREEILPALAGTSATDRYRLVSPSHPEGKDQEFFLCGQDGKRRARIRHDQELERGDLLIGAEIRGDVHASRVQTVKKIG